LYAAALGAAIALVAALAGCATPASITAGTPREAIVARLGPPAQVHAIDRDGVASRLVYPGGGLQQQTWVVDLDAAGRSLAVRQMLDFNQFMSITAGVDTRESVERRFGPPRLVQRYRSGLTAWLYAYQEAGFWNSEMAIYFDDSGRVVRTENGPDPRFMNDRDPKR
jgi:hypothetical protein